MAALAACSAVSASTQPQAQHTTAAPSVSGTAGGSTASRGGSTVSRGGSTTSHGGSTTIVRVATPGTAPLPVPAALLPFPGTAALAGEGTWHPAGRLVAGRPAVYETLLVPPGGTKPAGIAWMDMSLLTARLYSGSVSPGGFGYKYTAPVTSTAAASLVAAFNGGFKMADAHGGYYTEGRMIKPLVRGAASLVIYANGAVNLGAWDRDVTMTRSVVAVRQNLSPLVVDGKVTGRAFTHTWHVWGGTCPCGTGQHGTDNQLRSGLGITADGALVYVVGRDLIPAQVAELLVRAGAVRGMELDINPSWPVFATFKPATAHGLATAANGRKLTNTPRGPATFFDPSYARDFITVSAR